jgi:single-strand DNA-binding protein
MAEIKFVGNLGSDAVLRYTPSGRAVLNFSVADTKSKPDGNGGWEKLAEQWLDCAIWGELAEFYHDKLLKGSRATFYGEFYSRKYVNKEGVPGVGLDVVVKGVDIFPPKNGGQQQRQQQSGGNQQKEDPWAPPAGQDNSGGWGNGPDTEPPF